MHPHKTKKLVFSLISKIFIVLAGLMNVVVKIDFLENIFFIINNFHSIVLCHFFCLKFKLIDVKHVYLDDKLVKLV